MHRFEFKAEDLEQYFLDVMYNRRHNWYDHVLRNIMFVASRFFRMASQFRLWMYDKRVIRPRALGCLVISIGNLSCGGTGKTPVVEVFARRLCEQGRNVVILSRGYRRKSHGFMERWRYHRINGHPMPEINEVSDGSLPPKLTSIEAGDEPYMLAKNLEGVAVLVDKNRVEAGLFAIKEYRSDVIILDDGFQYLKLKPHVNIVLVDSTDPFGNGHVLPRGTLREPIKNIRRADYVFLTKSNGTHKINHLKRFVKRHTRRAEIIECCHQPQYLSLLSDEKNRLPLSSLNDAKVGAISAIARPESFEKFLSDYGARLVVTDHFADHHRYTEEEIRNFLIEAKSAGADYVVTTEKDAVRIPELADLPLPIYYLRIQIKILSGEESFDQCIDRICKLDS